MARWGKPEKVNWSGLPSSPTSFCIFPIRDEVFSPELKVLLVYNHADKGKKRPLVELLDPLAAQYDDGNKKGKPAAYGMPGGGLNPEWLESPEGAAIREGGNESGIRVIRVNLIPVPGKKNKALILNEKTDQLIRWIPYADGQQESIEIKPGEKILLNPMNYYLAEVDWLNSKVRNLFLTLKDGLVVGGLTEENIAQWGMSINTLTRDELLALGVDEEEIKEGAVEIGGFALLPISVLHWMVKENRFYLNPDEDRENRLNPTSYVYYSHVMRILEGIDIMGIA